MKLVEIMSVKNRLTQQSLGKFKTLLFFLVFFALSGYSLAQTGEKSVFGWPQGKKMALSISFDDSRTIQLTSAIPLLNQYNIKATFFLTVNQNMKDNVEAWKIVSKEGHEIGNHTINHPCSAKFSGPRKDGKSLETMSLKDIEEDILNANKEIERLVGVKPEVFAYPCGQTYVGEGTNTKSYVPIVAKHFLVGRGFMDEAPVNPLFPNMSQLNGINLGDDMSFEQVLPLIQAAKKNGSWLVFVCHDVGKEGHLNIPIATLRRLFEYVNNPENEIWVAPIGSIAHYVVKATQ